MIAVFELTIGLGAIPGILSLIGVVWLAAFKLSAIETKIDKLWKDNETWTDFHVRRSWSEIYGKGIATRNSPLHVAPETREWIAPLADKLNAFYNRIGRNMTQRELFLEIERNFGDQLLNEVCIPRGLSQGACIIIAMESMKR
jgi:hypothetical protein